jgi:hypothetical protein
MVKLLAVTLILVSILLASCPAPGVEPEGPNLTPEEEEQMAQRGVVNVDTVANASRIAGFPVAEPAYIPEGFSGGSFSVYQHGANLPENMKPKFIWIEAQSFYAWQGEERIMFILAQSQHKSTISGGEPAEICGHPGERWFDAAHDDMPPRLAFGWEDNGYYFALMSILDGPLDEETLMQIACSVKVE